MLMLFQGSYKISRCGRVWDRSGKTAVRRSAAEAQRGLEAKTGRPMNDVPYDAL
jgi:hypothetical protein